MYEELIKYLRVCAGDGDNVLCRGCPFDGRHDIMCLDGLMLAAADAIESLTATNSAEDNGASVS